MYPHGKSCTLPHASARETHVPQVNRHVESLEVVSFLTAVGENLRMIHIDFCGLNYRRKLIILLLECWMIVRSYILSPAFLLPIILSCSGTLP